MTLEFHKIVEHGYPVTKKPAASKIFKIVKLASAGDREEHEDAQASMSASRGPRRPSNISDVSDFEAWQSLESVVAHDWAAGLGTSKRQDEEAMSSLFSTLDESGLGFISPDQCQHAMRLCGFDNFTLPSFSKLSVSKSDFVRMASEEISKTDSKCSTDHASDEDENKIQALRDMLSAKSHTSRGMIHHPQPMSIFNITMAKIKAGKCAHRMHEHEREQIALLCEQRLCEQSEVSKAPSRWGANDTTSRIAVVDQLATITQMLRDAAQRLREAASSSAILQHEEENHDVELASPRPEPAAVQQAEDEEVGVSTPQEGVRCSRPPPGREQGGGREPILLGMSNVGVSNVQVHEDQECASIEEPREAGESFHKLDVSNHESIPASLQQLHHHRLEAHAQPRVPTRIITASLALPHLQRCTCHDLELSSLEGYHRVSLSLSLTLIYSPSHFGLELSPLEGSPRALSPSLPLPLPLPLPLSLPLPLPSLSFSPPPTDCQQ
jgi:hypothetical protein